MARRKRLPHVPKVREFNWATSWRFREIGAHLKRSDSRANTVRRLLQAAYPRWLTMTEICSMVAVFCGDPTQGPPVMPYSKSKKWQDAVKRLHAWRVADRIGIPKRLNGRAKGTGNGSPGPVILRPGCRYRIIRDASDLL